MSTSFDFAVQVDPTGVVASHMDEQPDLPTPASPASTSNTSSRSKPVLSHLTIPPSSQHHIGSKPPPRDKGWAAYRVLIAATIVSSFPCGIYLCFGVFHAFYQNSADFDNSNNSAWIGGLSSGVPFLAAPLIVYLCTHTRTSRIHYVWVGWLLGVLALVGAAFSPSIPALIITQGLLYGVGILLADNPLLLIVNTWFLSHRGMAYGIIFALCDLCGVAWSFMAEHLLYRYGLRTTFLIFAAITFFVPGPCILVLRERGSTTILRRSSLSVTTPNPTPASRSGREPCDDTLVSTIGGNFDLIRQDTPPTTRRFYKRPIFYILAVSNLFQSLAFYLPLIYLPTYTATLNLPSSTGALTLALINLAQILGEVSFGQLSDHLNIHLLAILSSTLSALSVLLLWGYAHSPVQLYLFALAYGFAAAGFCALWARMGTLFGERDAQMVFGVMCAGRGAGSVVCGPVSEALLRRGGSRRGRGWASAAGGKWAALVGFVGGCMAVSAVLGGVGFVVDLPERDADGRRGKRAWTRRQSVVRRVEGGGMGTEEREKGGGVAT
ncbi:uncharacterized protein HMPREF1541_07324 [Cyphellophora europaea CBS 101466]|uniref:Major facilitator superfamily (MFS) profile domain-containing protein n=1 Tax=Cyphellophora europaea (strain CBS 101466) TaxID=1220924 RepID=W2RMF0_CYPE1|nr:uncharacterized protein HMPREF1541_07324 [Cyphellophora europaea CBS 101466]ETN37701.1 hypothetical protein HMPREF1541_07324 [Cyphellophora europaea CBS 101466]